MVSLKDGLTWAAVAVQGIAALLWLASTFVKISADKVVKDYEKEHGPGWAPAQIVGDDGSDFYATIQRQSRWNRWAALATGVGIALQAGATAIT